MKQFRSDSKISKLNYTGGGIKTNPNPKVFMVLGLVALRAQALALVLHWFGAETLY